MKFEEIKSILINKIFVNTLPHRSISEVEIENADLIDDYIIDSIIFITFIVEIENEFNIQIPDEILLYDKFRTLKDTIENIQKLLNQKHKA